MHGRITRIAVTYTLDTPDGPRHTFHGLFRSGAVATRVGRAFEAIDASH
jgi:hypothetical protein